MKKRYGKLLQLYHGDFREVAKDKVKDNSVQLLFTDPMYGFKDLSTYADLAKLASRTLEDGRSTVFNANSKFIPQIIEMMSKEDLHWEDIFIVELEGPFKPGWPNTVDAKSVD